MNQLEIKIKAAWEYRRAKVQSERLQAFRLINGLGDELPGLSVDVFAGNFFVQIKSAEWSPKLAALEIALQAFGAEIQPETEWEIFVAENLRDGFRWLREREKTFAVEEAGSRFQIQLGVARHPGLFLDQRDNRKRIRGHAGGKSVLNLFCYTGAFSIVALQGHAESVCSVDISKNYLAWYRKNLELNGLGEAQTPMHARDVFEFLRQSKERFDLVIIDPPSFSRGKTGNFSTEKNLEQLLSASAEVLTPGGRILASINTEKLGLDAFIARAKAAIKPHGLRVMEIFPLPFDFRLAESERKNPYLKAGWLG